MLLGALLASIWIAGNVDANVGEASIYATQSALKRSQLSYNQAHERQADISQRAMTAADRSSNNGFDLSFDLLRIYQKINLASTPLPSIAELVAGIDELSAHYGLLIDYAKALTNKRLGDPSLAAKQLQSIHHQ